MMSKYLGVNNRTLIVIAILSLLFASLLIAYSINLNPTENNNASDYILLMLTSPIFFAIGLLFAMKGSAVAKNICGAWLVFLLVSILLLLQSETWFNKPINFGYLLLIAAILQTILMGLALNFHNDYGLSKSISEKKKAISERDRAIDELNVVRTDYDTVMLNYKKALSDYKQAKQNEKLAIQERDAVVEQQETEQLDLSYSIEERNLELEIALRELSEKNAALEKLTAIDALTNLMNRRFFDKRVIAESRRSKREMTTLGFAMLDIDHFKHINDKYGHLGGDHCLRVFADVLKQAVKRPSDVICRYGGEEFVLILPNTDESGLTQLLEQIRKAVQDKRIHFEGHEISMTVSIGACARVISADDEHKTVLALADKLLYEAKQKGRNTVVIGS